MKRSLLMRQLAQIIGELKMSHPIRVAIDGVDAAGKTIFADTLAQSLELHGRQVIRASVDGFHRPRDIRYRQGSSSAQGYYQDSFDYEALCECLLDPLGPGGDGRFKTAIFDVQSDRPIDVSVQQASENVILIFDGVFLLRPQLLYRWDVSIFVDVAFDITIARAIERDKKIFGSAAETKSRYNQRYIPGQQLYLGSCRPRESADILIDNNDPNEPELLRLTPVDFEVERQLRDGAGKP